MRTATMLQRLDATVMQQYLDLLRHVRDHGARKDDRTGTGTLSVFGYQMRFDLAQGFPLVTTKKLHLKSIVYELLWFLKGDTNVNICSDHGVTIWDEWADENGELGPIYGKQWRSWPTPDGKSIDQISRTVDLIRRNPDSRRIIVNAWNVGELEQMSLTPCHALFQFWVGDGRLSCQLYQRSADMFLGVPFNIASYALLTHMFAQQCDLQSGEFIWTGGDCHLYLNHLEQADEQLRRTPYPLPRLAIKRKPPSIFEYEYEDFQIAELPGASGASRRRSLSDDGRSIPFSPCSESACPRRHATKSRRSRQQVQDPPKKSRKPRKPRKDAPIATSPLVEARNSRDSRPRRVRDRADQEGHARSSSISASGFRTPKPIGATRRKATTTVTRSCSSPAIAP